LCIDCPVSIEKIRTIVKSVSKVALSQIKTHKPTANLEAVVLTIRMVISSGHGDFGIASLVEQPLIQGKKPTFYAIASEPFINYELEKQGVKEFVVKTVDSSMENSNHPKSVSYAENAIMANESKVDKCEAKLETRRLSGNQNDKRSSVARSSSSEHRFRIC
jgi:hypothetical protein